jgi:hypothetical protein
MKTILLGLVECTAVGLRTSWVSFLVASLLEFIDSIDSHSSSRGVVGNWGLPCVSTSDWLTDKSWGGTIEVSTDCRNINSKYIRHKKKRQRAPTKKLLPMFHASTSKNKETQHHICEMDIIWKKAIVSHWWYYLFKGISLLLMDKKVTCSIYLWKIANITSGGRESLC